MDGCVARWYGGRESVCVCGEGKEGEKEGRERKKTGKAGREGREGKRKRRGRGGNEEEEGWGREAIFVFTFFCVASSALGNRGGRSL